MAKLTPNTTYTMNGVTINEKIIPDGTRWTDAAKAVKAGFAAGSLYKKQAKLSGGTDKVQFVTVHNTNDLANVYDDGEQYTRANFNENMNSSGVHFYIDDTGVWQNLKAGTDRCPTDPKGSAKVSWHSYRHRQGHCGPATGLYQGQKPAVSKSVLDMASLYLSEGAAEGIRGGYCFCPKLS